MRRAEVAIIATPTMGNLVPAVEFATHLTNHHLSVTILIISMPHWPLVDDYIKSRTSTEHIRFIQIPHQPPPDQYNSVIEFISMYIDNHKPMVKQTLKNLLITPVSNSARVPFVGLFVDMFCTSMIDVANDLNIQSYLFFASPAAYLGFVLHLTTLPTTESATESIDSVTELTIPSFAKQVPSKALPLFCIKKNEFGYSTFVRHALRYKETKGIVVNTFWELEPYALDSLSCSGIDLPRIYPVGPIIDHVGPAMWHPNRFGHEKTIEWLDLQPESSVVFLCFGSMGSLTADQVREIATGLERAGYRFLWALREPAKEKLKLPDDYEKLDDNLFPDGFFDRTAETGLVCGWVPQVSVLAHKAIGGFVSHCGWNSILESIWYGVPVATWPLYGEQQLNAFEMARELELSVEIRLDSRDKGGDLVLAEEVERGLRKLMDGGDGELRKKVKEMSERSKKCLMENGTTYKALEGLVNFLLSNK